MESLFKAVSNTVIVTTRFTIELAVGALCGAAPWWYSVRDCTACSKSTHTHKYTKDTTHTMLTQHCIADKLSVITECRVVYAVHHDGIIAANSITSKKTMYKKGGGVVMSQCRARASRASS